jgi:hypothetical protein
MTTSSSTSVKPRRRTFLNKYMAAPLMGDDETVQAWIR